MQLKLRLKTTYVFLIVCLILHLFFIHTFTWALGNTKIQSYSQAKQILTNQVYMQDNERKTLYCEARFDAQKNITLPAGFVTQKFKNRVQKVEWEHVVPAEHFGRYFLSWREGDNLCKNMQNKPFRGRKCAEKVSAKYRYMQADMYNIFPSIGAVNASRSNYNFALLPHVLSNFGLCLMKVEGRKVEPPEKSRGKIARAYMYMEQAYATYEMSKTQRKLMQAWDEAYPVTKDECLRTKRIELLQGNENYIVKSQCLKHGLW